jgi:hypothetical protein
MAGDTAGDCVGVAKMAFCTAERWLISDFFWTDILVLLRVRIRLFCFSRSAYMPYIVASAWPNSKRVSIARAAQHFQAFTDRDAFPQDLAGG